VAQGKDVTVIGYSSMTHRCEKLLPRLQEQGVSAELIDLRTVDYPGIDYDTIDRSVRKTGAVVVVEEAPRSQTIGSTIAKTVTERCFDSLDAPVACLSSRDVPPPVSRALEKAALISDDEIVAGVAAVAGREL
jgi:pyruvate/2-oxoglutarate/acetoin dehydrogenase E1 component